MFFFFGYYVYLSRNANLKKYICARTSDINSEISGGYITQLGVDRECWWSKLRSCWLVMRDCLCFRNRSMELRDDRRSS